MAEGEQFSWSKFFGGFVNGLTWAKNIQFVAWLAIIAIVGFTIYRAYFMKTTSQQQRNTQTINAATGSNVHVDAPGQVMKVDEKNWQVGVFGGANADNEVFGGLILLRRF